MNDLIKKYYLEKQFNCAETILLSASEEYGLNIDESTVKIMSGFSGGMFEEDVCGAVSGGIAALSLIFNDKTKLEKAVKAFKNNVKNNLSSIDCRDIKPIHRNLKNRCGNVIDKAFNLLKEIVKENK